MGYVYVFRNPAMPGLYKIGWARDVRKRQVQLYKDAGVPDRFYTEAVYDSDRASLLEAQLHSLLDIYRYNPEKEFFKINIHLLRRKVREQMIDLSTKFLHSIFGTVYDWADYHNKFCEGLQKSIEFYYSRFWHSGISNFDSIIKDFKETTEHCGLRGLFVPVEEQRRALVYVDLFSKNYAFHFGMLIRVGTTPYSPFEMDDDLNLLCKKLNGPPLYKEVLDMLCNRIPKFEERIIAREERTRARELRRQ